MLRATVVVTVAVIAACAPGAHAAAGSLDMTVYRDGLAHVVLVFEVDPLAPIFPLELLGPTVDNFVATDGEGRLLSAEISHGVAVLNTLGTDLVRASYDVHDLISKEGRIWTFSLDAPQNYTLLMPADAVIVGMDAVPRGFTVADGRAHLEMPGGSAEMNYILNAPEHETPAAADGDAEDAAVYAAMAGIPAVAGAAGAALVARVRSRRPRAAEPAAGTGAAPPPAGAPTAEEIFSRVPDIREEDRDIVRYITDNGGERLESELRREFLQPRTTMWRAVKRLERLGVVAVTKRDSQNLVRIRRDAGEGP